MVDAAIRTKSSRAPVVGRPAPAAGSADNRAPNERLQQQIYSKLKHGLMAGHFVPGQTLTIRALAERFGTSVMPVRDALARLVAERVFRVGPNRTIKVGVMSRSRFQEILQVRLSLEPQLTRRAAEICQPRFVEELERHNERMQSAVEANNPAQYLEANQTFHFYLYSLVETEVILPIVENMWMQIGPFLHWVFTKAGTFSARDNHAGILRALRRNDAIAAAQAVTSDLAEAADLILARSDLLNE